MTSKQRTRLARGIVPLLGFTLFTASLDVYAGKQLQEHSPVTVAALSFTLAGAFFLGGDVVRRGAAAAFRPLHAHRYDTIMINMTTALTWLSMLYALKFLEPAVVTAVGMALGPLLTVSLSPLLRPGSSVLRSETLVSLGIGVMIGFLVWGSFTGRSGIGELSFGEAAAGVGMTLLTGVGSVANVIYSKRLSEAGLSPQSVLAVRFFLMVALSWAMVIAIAKPGIGPALLPSALIAVIGVALPLYLLQVGIKHTEPITASILLTLSPLFAFVLQLPGQRLHPSMLTLLGIIGITASVAVGIVARGRHDARAGQAASEIADSHSAAETS